jgi:hypothetical protein
MEDNRQITKHEWETEVTGRTTTVHRCKNCPVIRVKQLLFNQPQYYYNRETGVNSTECPKCITRKKPEDERTATSNQ